MTYTTGKANKADVVKSNIYNRENSKIICFIPAPFIFRIATSFCRRSVSRVIAEYTPNKVIIRLTIEKNKEFSFHGLLFNDIIQKSCYFGLNTFR